MSCRKMMVGLLSALAFAGTAWAGSQADFRLKVPGKNFRLSETTCAKTDSLVVADAGTRVALSMDDLGFSKEETESDPKLQKDLEARSDMLKIHQTLGLITCVPMLTNYILGLTSADDDLLLHGGLGFATTGLYLTTASFAIFAPHVKGVKSKGNSDLHQILAIIHGACMVVTPLLGEMAEDEAAAKDLHFITTTGLVASYVTAMAIMTF